MKKNRQDIFYENTQWKKIKQIDNYFISKEGYIFTKNKTKKNIFYWIIEDPFMKILKIKNSEIIQFTRDLNLSWVILKRNFINGVKNKNTYNIIDVEKDSFKKIKIKNNFFKGYKIIERTLLC